MSHHHDVCGYCYQYWCVCATTKPKEKIMGESKQWVQHISGQGEKWEVNNTPYTSEHEWRVLAKADKVMHFLPRSEYRLCDPPERWEDVTDRCSTSHWGRELSLPEAFLCAPTLPAGYRLRKVTHYVFDGSDTKQVHAFIVERKVQ